MVLLAPLWVVLLPAVSPSWRCCIPILLVSRGAAFLPLRLVFIRVFSLEFHVLHFLRKSPQKHGPDRAQLAQIGRSTSFSEAVPLLGPPCAPKQMWMVLLGLLPSVLFCCVVLLGLLLLVVLPSSPSFGWCCFHPLPMWVVLLSPLLLLIFIPKILILYDDNYNGVVFVFLGFLHCFFFCGGFF